MITPIKPSEVASKKQVTFPDAVIETFNELIVENFSGGSATVDEDEAVKRMVKKGLKRAEIYKKGWLDVEEVYEAQGWSVNYDKPGYNETYPASFEFSKK